MKKLLDAIDRYRFDEASAFTSRLACKAKKLAITEKVLFVLGGILFMLLAALESMYLLAGIASPEELLRYPILVRLADFCQRIDGAVLGLLGLKQAWYFHAIFWLLTLFALPLLLALILRLVLPGILPVKEQPCTGNTGLDQTLYVQTKLKSLTCDGVEILPYNVIFAIISTLIPLSFFVFEVFRMYEGVFDAEGMIGLLVGFAVCAAVLYGLFLALHSGFLALCCFLCYTGLGYGDKDKALKGIDKALKLHEQTQKRLKEQAAKEKADEQQRRSRTAANIHFQCAITNGSATGDDPYMQKAAQLGHPQACLLVGQLRFDQLRTAISQGTLTAAERAKETELVLSYLKTAADARHTVGEFLHIAANALLGRRQSAAQWDSWLQRLRRMRQENALPENCTGLYDEVLPLIVTLVDQTRAEERERAFQAAREAYRQSFAYAESFPTSAASPVTIPEKYQYNGEYGHDHVIFGNLHFVADLDYDQRQYLTDEYWRLHPEPVELEIDMDQ